MESFFSNLSSVPLLHYFLYLFFVGFAVATLLFLRKKLVKDAIEFSSLKYLRFFPRKKSKIWILSSFLVLLAILGFGFLILLPLASDRYSHAEDSSDNEGVLMVIMDVSGSMGTKYRLTQEAFKELVEIAGGRRISLVIYSDEAYISRLTDDERILLSDFSGIGKEGLYYRENPWEVISSGTNTAVAIARVKDFLQKYYPDRENIVMIFSDFEDEPHDVVPAIRDLKESIGGLKLYLVGIGKAPSYEDRRARIFLGVRDFWVDGTYEIITEAELLSVRNFFRPLFPDTSPGSTGDEGQPFIISNVNDIVLWLGIAVLGCIGLTVLFKEVILRKIP